MRDQILAALARGDFVNTWAGIQFPSSGELPERLRARFDLLHGCSDSLRRLLRGAKRLAESWGVRVPAPVKAQLRRVF